MSRLPLPCNWMMQLGNELLAQNQYPKALLHFTRVLDSSPQSPEAFFGRATAFIHLNDFPSAKLDLENALQLDQGSVNVTCQLAYVLLHEGDSIEALKLYTSLITKTNLPPKFKPILKNSIDLTISRAKSQGYTKEEIDAIYTNELANILSTWDGYKVEKSQQRQSQQPQPQQQQSANVIHINPGNVTTNVSNDANGRRVITTTTTRPTNGSFPPFDLNAIINTHRETLNDPNNPLNPVFNVGSNIATVVDLLRNNQHPVAPQDQQQTTDNDPLNDNSTEMDLD